MHRRQFFALGLGAAAACLAGCSAGTPSADVLGRVSVISGGEPWVPVARALTRTLRTAGYLAQGRAATTITVTGLTALATVQRNEGASVLDTTTPLARLVGEPEVVVVPVNSRHADFDAFAAHLTAEPSRTMLAGRPEGEADHLLFGLIAKGLGADTRLVDYAGYPSTAEAAAALLAGRAAVAAGPLCEWRSRIDRGKVRALAVSSAERVEGLDVPTLLESGVRVDFADWCAVLGPGGMREDARAAAIAMCDRVAESERWQDACRTGGWRPLPLSGDAFAQWLGSEVERTHEVLFDLGLLDTPGTSCGDSCGGGH
ncbi:tripartite tricarboxylate transporter substrate-binding protein [Nonomuraea sp. NPDC050556]|uniref:tripartite tricarboxylate transporter substrate-binding protein n=1 Tax=Nonomuraea sp. NPDC050556 TaxID=3364369 RepID=UPI00379E85A7